MKLPIALVAAASVCSVGCFYPASRGKVLEDEVEQLRANAQSLEESLQKERVHMRTTLDSKIAEVSAALEALDKASRRSGADIGVQQQKTVEDVAQLRGTVDQYVHRIEELEASLQKLSHDTESRLTEMKGPEAVKAAEAQKKAAELQRPSEPAPFLALARSKVAEDPELARQLYWEFLKKWPKDGLASEAHLGLGEALEKDTRCREALSEYGKVIQDYPKSKSAPSAYLKSAGCFRQLKLNDDAKLALEELVRAYPKSDAAKLAKVQLQDLEKSGKKGTPKKGGK